MSQVNKIWLLMGQSFITGISGDLPSLQAAYDGLTINNRIWQLGGFQCINQGTNNNQYPNQGNGFSIEFYFKDIADLLDRDVYLIKVSEGGIPLALRSGTDWNTASVGELYDLTLDAIQDAKDWMDDRGKSYSFEGVVWWQGEEDSKTLSYANAYQTNEINLYDGLKTATGNNSLKFYQYNIIANEAGTFRAYTDEVNTAKQNFNAIDTANRKIFTPVITSWNADGIHPSPTGQLDLWNDYQKDLIINDL